MTNPENPESWRATWREAADAEYTQDFAGELRSAVDFGLGEPNDTLGVACVGVEATEALIDALSDDWALYTPQQAAVVASAAFAQVESAAVAMRHLRIVIRAMAERGDVDLPAPADHGPANITSALSLLEKAAFELSATVGQYAQEVTTALRTAPAKAPLPADVHQTIAAVAELLGGDARLNQRHEPGYVGDGDGFGCGCDIDFTHAGEEWNFHRGDSCWSLTRERDGRPTADGGTVFSKWLELEASEETAHPAHLVALIRQELSS